MTALQVPGLSRRRLLQAVAAAAVVLPVATPGDAGASADFTRATMEAWADTIVPGEKRYPGDKVVLGAAPGPGAVQAGAWALYQDPDIGLAGVLPALATLINVEATTWATLHGQAGRLLDVTEPAFVNLDLKGRTAVVQQLVQGEGVVQLLWYALAAMATLAFHTAAHLDTATAVRNRHPGLAWLGFPDPDPDEIWRFPEFSYRRALAPAHPATTASGNPA
ncbi:DUF5987 family protein [Marmoricola sp. RAF53]|uniref:DUF5987 family protein n=1 Tax=Marmoricola sp. RAF53 TaxID=3233059 RepID=UPI003F9B64B6